MGNKGLFDLMSFLLDGIQTIFSSFFPVVLSLGLWALLAAFLSMWVYGKFSNQDALNKIKPLQKAASKRLAVYDGPFDGLMPLIKENLSLSGRHMWLTLFPALLATLPLLFILPWLSNTFGVYFPTAGSPVPIALESYTPHELHWKSARGEYPTAGVGRWTIPWPQQSAPEQLLDRREGVVLVLPPIAATSILHKRQWWNVLLGNPAGYLKPDSVVESLSIGLPELQVIPYGPGWMRGWLPTFMLFLFSFSMLFKWRWRLR